MLLIIDVHIIEHKITIFGFTSYHFFLVWGRSIRLKIIGFDLNPPNISWSLPYKTDTIMVIDG